MKRNNEKYPYEEYLSKSFIFIQVLKELSINDTPFLYLTQKFSPFMKRKNWIFGLHMKQKKYILVVSFANHYIHKRFQEKNRIGSILGVSYWSFGSTDCILIFIFIAWVSCEK